MIQDPQSLNLLSPFLLLHTKLMLLSSDVQVFFHRFSKELH